MDLGHVDLVRGPWTGPVNVHPQQPLPSTKVMVHWPMPGKHVEAYLALEELVKNGKAKGLGFLVAQPPCLGAF